MTQYDHLLAKSDLHGKTTLVRHLKDVDAVAERIAGYTGLNRETAYKGAVLHDIGKASPLFQQTLVPGFQRSPGFVFRHEIASLFFLSLVPEPEQAAVIEMIVAHHKSIYKDSKGMGLLDLKDNCGNCFEKHAQDFSKWSGEAVGILRLLGLEGRDITEEEARANYEQVCAYCLSRTTGYSRWKGVLMAADHLASAMNHSLPTIINRLFIRPDLSYYNRQHELYPLSGIRGTDTRQHTIVTAPTGAGKTDFLMKRCRGRVFYTLPFQASINAMYDRFKADLKDTGAEIHLLHAASAIKTDGAQIEEKILQRHIGASVKVLTPHQLASLVFATKGYEALIVDLHDCDVILDEIHTYSSTIQAIVLKIVAILAALNCRVHIGTATMPAVLYNNLLQLLGGPSAVYEVRLSEPVLKSFNRHIVHKATSFSELQPVIEAGIEQQQKILLVCNQVARAQALYAALQEQFPAVAKMLLHSRFKRGERTALETKLKTIFNTSAEACIVVSTQVVEVSLDISFDLMITEAAPIDALIQRFGRINRKRTADTIGNLKPVYVLQPPDSVDDARPYDLDVLKRSYAVLPDGALLEEAALQTLIDQVYPSMVKENIDLSVGFANGRWRLKELWHRPKSALLEALEMDAATCIDERDREAYELGSYAEQSRLEIPVAYKSIAFKGLEQIRKAGSCPFVVPAGAYSRERGLQLELVNAGSYDVTLQFL